MNGLRILIFTTTALASGSAISQDLLPGQLTYLGEAKQRFGDDSPNATTVRGTWDYLSNSGFGGSAGGQVRFFDAVAFNTNRGDMTVWEFDTHLYYELSNGLRIGGYYAYEGSKEVNDFQYFGGEAMYTVRGFDIEGKVGAADNVDGSGTAFSYEAAAYYTFENSLGFGAGYAGITDSGRPDYNRAFGRVEYAGIIPDNNITLFAEVSYYDFSHLDDTSIAIGAEVKFGGDKSKRRRLFRKPTTLLDF